LKQCEKKKTETERKKFTGFERASRAVTMKRKIKRERKQARKRRIKREREKRRASRVRYSTTNDLSIQWLNRRAEPKGKKSRRRQE